MQRERGENGRIDGCRITIHTPSISPRPLFHPRGWVFALVEALENDPCAHGLALGFLTFLNKSYHLQCYYDTCWINVICQESSKLRFNTIGLIIRRLFVMKMLLPMLPNRATKARAEKGQMMTPRRHRPLDETGGTVWPPGEKLERRATQSDGSWTDADPVMRNLQLTLYC